MVLHRLRTTSIRRPAGDGIGGRTTRPRFISRRAWSSGRMEPCRTCVSRSVSPRICISIRKRTLSPFWKWFRGHRGEIFRGEPLDPWDVSRCRTEGLPLLHDSGRIVEQVKAAASAPSSSLDENRSFRGSRSSGIWPTGLKQAHTCRPAGRKPRPGSRMAPVLLGDAAHAMNPHASQGRMQAMVDAMTLADLIPTCLERGDCSAARLRAYEQARRRRWGCYSAWPMNR